MAMFFPFYYLQLLFKYINSKHAIKMVSKDINARARNIIIEPPHYARCACLSIIFIKLNFITQSTSKYIAYTHIPFYTHTHTHTVFDVLPHFKYVKNSPARQNLIEDMYVEVHARDINQFIDIFILKLTSFSFS